MKKSIAIIWLIFLFTGVIGLFWYNDWVYSLPTPLPEKHQTVNLGEKINIKWRNKLSANKPTLIHFFNPDCPCSRFNIPHFKSLVKQYGDQVNFVIVPVTHRALKENEIQNKFGMDIPVLEDSDIARVCGVYSTPQAVILDTDHQLFYRGNYNKSRYCTDKKTEYAKIALDAMVNNNLTLVFDPIALKAYGCKLPLCNK